MLMAIIAFIFIIFYLPITFLAIFARTEGNDTIVNLLEIPLRIFRNEYPWGELSKFQKVSIFVNFVVYLVGAGFFLKDYIIFFRPDIFENNAIIDAQNCLIEQARKGECNYKICADFVVQNYPYAVESKKIPNEDQYLKSNLCLDVQKHLAAQADDDAWRAAQDKAAQDDHAIEALQAYLNKYPFGRHSREANDQIYAKTQAAAKADEDAWATAQRVGTVDAYQAYVAQFPAGSHVRDANDHVAALLERRAAEQADDDAWATAQQADAVEAYQKYLGQFPAGIHARDAQARIATITANAAAAAKADDDAWATAQQADAVEAYQKYLGQFPVGIHTRDAQARIAALKANAAAAAKADDDAWVAAQRADTVDVYREYRSRYSNGAHIWEAQARINALVAAQAAAKADDGAWSNALQASKNAQTADACREYLSDHPKGAHIADAQRCIDAEVIAKRDAQCRDEAARVKTLADARDRIGLQSLSSVAECKPETVDLIANVLAQLPPPADTPDQLERANFLLKRIGCYMGSESTFSVSRVKDALKAYYRIRHEKTDDLTINDGVLAQLEKEGDQRVCSSEPKNCGSGRHVRRGRCVPDVPPPPVPPDPVDNPFCKNNCQR